MFKMRHNDIFRVIVAHFLCWYSCCITINELESESGGFRYNPQNEMFMNF